eukprot:3044595-Rhodomonas_salina.2
MFTALNCSYFSSCSAVYVSFSHGNLDPRPLGLSNANATAEIESFGSGLGLHSNPHCAFDQETWPKVAQRDIHTLAETCPMGLPLNLVDVTYHLAFSVAYAVT